MDVLLAGLFIVGTIIWLALEFATDKDMRERGKFGKHFKTSLKVVMPFFVIGSGIYLGVRWLIG